MSQTDNVSIITVLVVLLVVFCGGFVLGYNLGFVNSHQRFIEAYLNGVGSGKIPGEKPLP